MVFGRERPTFGDETISIASYCFQKFSSVNIEQQECCVQFWYFSGFVWTFLCINCVFNALWAQFKFELHAHDLMHINWLKIQICVLGCMLRSHARNGNEFQTPCHRHSAAHIEIPGFYILVNSKLVWNSWNLACYHGAASTCRGKFSPFGEGLGIRFSQTRASHNKPDGFGRECFILGDEMISIASYCFQICFSCQHITTGVLCDFLWFFGVRLDIFMH